MDADLVKKAVQEVLTRIQSSQKLKCPELVDTLKPIKDLENANFMTSSVGRPWGPLCNQYEQRRKLDGRGE